MVLVPFNDIHAEDGAIAHWQLRDGQFKLIGGEFWIRLVFQVPGGRGDFCNVLMVLVLEVLAVVGDGRIDHNPPHPPLEREILSVTLDVLEDLDEAVLQDILSVLPAVGMAQGCGKELATETGIHLALRSGFLCLALLDEQFQLF